MNMVARHRLVYGLGGSGDQGRVHALSLKTKTLRRRRAEASSS